MSDSVFNRYKAKIGDDPQPGEPEAADDFVAFGWLRGIRERAVMLELRHRDGSSTAFGYTWLEKAAFDPSEGITLYFAGKKVRIIGRNLNGEISPLARLYHGILRQRVPWIQQADLSATITASDKNCLIETFDFKV
jgi:hypothetical protein